MSLAEMMAFGRDLNDKQERVSLLQILGKSIPGRRNSRGKGWRENCHRN